MMLALQWVLSILFVVQMYLMMAVFGIGYLPYAILRREGALAATHAYARYVRWSARVMLGLKSELRGEVPAGEVVIAAKHQSFFDIIIIYSELPRPRFIMKKELVYAPFLGWYALRVGCVPVDRGKRGQAIAKLKEDVARGATEAGQLVIYPQGTRVAPGDYKPYKVGVGLIYDQLGCPCIPAAANVGLFWPKRSLLRKRGTAVVELLAPIPPGLPVAEVMERIEAQVEEGSNRLMAQADIRG
ncbi:MAG: lysophospholipid acyltransferase family protein [Paracoccaceae bacterium]